MAFNPTDIHYVVPLQQTNLPKSNYSTKKTKKDKKNKTCKEQYVRHMLQRYMLKMKGFSKRHILITKYKYINEISLTFFTFLL